VSLKRGEKAMSQTEALPAPVLAPREENKWRREQEAFRRLLPDLLKTHRDQFVAVHEGRVVEAGRDKLAVAGQAYARFGYVPIYVRLVTDQPPEVARVRNRRATLIPRLRMPGERDESSADECAARADHETRPTTA
jgi:hypothetical protein